MSSMTPYVDAQIKLANEKKKREELEKNALQNNLALMGRFLGGGVDRYGRQIPMNASGALGVGLGHILGGALWRWLNRDKSIYDKVDGTPVNSAAEANAMLKNGEYWADGNETSPEAGQDNPYTALLGQEAMRNWDTAINNTNPNLNYTYNADSVLPIGDIANGTVIPNNYNFEDEFKRNGGILGNLRYFGR